MKINIYNITFIENCCLKKDLFPSPIQSLFRLWRRCTRKWRKILDFSCKMLTEKTRLPLTFLRFKRNHFASKVFSINCQSHCFQKSDFAFPIWFWFLNILTTSNWKQQIYLRKIRVLLLNKRIFNETGQSGSRWLASRLVPIFPEGRRWTANESGHRQALARHKNRL